MTDRDRMFSGWRSRGHVSAHQDRQLTLVPSGWQSLAHARAVRRRQRLRWRCVASARSDIRRPPVGQPLALFFTIALPFAGTDVASEAANEPRLGGQLRASHPAAWRGARVVETRAGESRRVEPSADAQRRKRARVSGQPRPCLASSLWSSVRSEPSPARITAGGARAARAARVVTGGSRRRSRVGTSRELWGRAGVRALGVSFDGTIELGAAAAGARARRHAADAAKAAAGWPNCLLLFSAARARRELGLGLCWEHSRVRVERETTSSEGQGHCTTTGTGGYGRAMGTSSKRARAQSGYEERTSRSKPKVAHARVATSSARARCE